MAEWSVYTQQANTIMDGDTSNSREEDVFGVLQDAANDDTRTWPDGRIAQVNAANLPWDCMRQHRYGYTCLKARLKYDGGNRETFFYNKGIGALQVLLEEIGNPKNGLTTRVSSDEVWMHAGQEFLGADPNHPEYGATLNKPVASALALRNSADILTTLGGTQNLALASAYRDQAMDFLRKLARTGGSVHAYKYVPTDSSGAPKLDRPAFYSYNINTGNQVRKGTGLSEDDNYHVFVMRRLAGLGIDMGAGFPISEFNTQYPTWMGMSFITWLWTVYQNRSLSGLNTAQTDWFEDNA